MQDDNLPSLRFRIVPTSAGADVVATAYVPHHIGGKIETRTNLSLFAAAMVRYKLEALRQSQITTVFITEAHFGVGGAEQFLKVWNFLKNTIRTTPANAAGEHLGDVGALAAIEKSRTKAIEINAARLPDGNVTFSVISRTGIPYEIRSEPDLLALFDFLLGRRNTTDYIASISGSHAPAVSVTPFLFGNSSTKTTVVHRFADGLPPNRIKCSLADVAFSVPPEIELLIESAHLLLQPNAPGIRQVADHQMLAPARVTVSVDDLDSSATRLELTLAESSYRYYAAFAFAELLASRDQAFAPLLEFTRAVSNPSQPGPACCSIGVRVMLRTVDDKLVVAYRSNQVKLNPDVWSASANEGVRTQLLKLGQDCSDLLTLAARRAVKNELRIEADLCSDPLLLSVYRNAFNQWGAGFWMKTELSSVEVIGRQSAADHGFEHKRVAALPLGIQQCGQAMRDLGIRWYGGALQTLCDVLTWREVSAGRYPTPEAVGASLSKAAGDAILPIDEPNLALLPSGTVPV